MPRSQDELVEIPKTMHKYFGGSGQMVKPASATVESLVEAVPAGMLVTIDSLREHLAKTHKVRTSCPSATLKALAEASIANPEFCAWRVVKKNGELIAKLPGGLDRQAQLLMHDGLVIDRSKKTPAVTNFNDHLYSLG